MATYAISVLMLGDGDNKRQCSSVREARKFLKNLNEDHSSFGVLYFVNEGVQTEFLCVVQLSDGEVYIRELAPEGTYFLLHEQNGSLCMTSA